MASISISRQHKIHHISFLIILTLIIFHPLSAFSQVATTITPESEAALEEELRWLRAETYVITPSRIPEKIKKTAASITVITDKQIRKMGARNLIDILRTIPGMGYYYNWLGLYNIVPRGSEQALSHNVLFMINGHPLNNHGSGGAGWVYDTIIVDNIERIEVLRSPASAVYGANAFDGVINIINKQAEDVDGLEFTARGGSYDTQQYNLLYGKTFNEVEVAFNLNFSKTHGYRGHIEEDLLTPIDQEFGTNFSLAPGDMQGDDEKYDIALTLKYKGLMFDGRFVNRDRDFTVGWEPILRNHSTSSAKDYYLNLIYEWTLWERLDFSAKVYRNHNFNRSNLQLYPPGIPGPPPLNAVFPDGVIRIGELKNNKTGIELQTTYRIAESNTLVAGAIYEEAKAYDSKTKTNAFTLGVFTFPLRTVRDLSGIVPNQEGKRNLKGFFIEDVWDIKDNLRFTAGVRYDRYSDFGSEVSPRAGLVWEYVEGYDLKLLYGHAFRAPAFWELNGLGGNPDLDAETVDHYEVSLGAEFTFSLFAGITFFHKEGNDIIFVSGITPFQHENLFKTRSQGFEVELNYDFGRGTYLALNYAYTRFISPHTTLRFDNSIAPRHKGNLMANIRLSRYLNFYAQCHIEDGFRREPRDTRDDMSGYATVDATVIAKKFLEGYEGLEIRGSVYNLLDKDYTSPQPEGLPHDLPRPGRNFIIELKYKF